MKQLDFSVCFPVPKNIQDAGSMGQLIENAGFTRVWVPDESTWRSSYQTSAIIGEHTKDIKFGPGLTNPYTRHPVVTGVEMATLHTDFGCRGILGIGPGDFHFLQSLGMSWRQVTQTLIEAIQIVRLVVAGKPIEFHGQVFSVTDLQLKYESRNSPPLEIGLGCRGPKLAETAGKVADRVLLDGIPQKGLPDVIKRVRLGEEQAQRTKGACGIGCFFGLGIDNNTQRAKQQAKRNASWSIAMAHPFALEAAGLSKTDVQPVFDALPDLDAATDKISDELVKQFALTGTVDDVITQLDTYADMGLEEVILMIPRDSSLQLITKIFGKEILPSFSRR